MDLPSNQHITIAPSLRLGPLLGLVALSVAAIVIGGLLTAPAIPGWYAGISKPSWTPPNWVFAPVWTTLYLAMAFAAWLVLRSAGGFAGARGALILYFVQFTLNILWSPLFFGLHWTGLALVDIALLALTLAATTLAFWRKNRLAGLILLPYLLWVLYASSLNFGIVMLAGH